MTILVSFSSIVVAWLYPHSKELFSILGAFFGTLIIVTVPGTMMCTYLSGIKKLCTFKGIFFLIWTCIFTVLGFICGVQLIVGSITGN